MAITEVRTNLSPNPSYETGTASVAFYGCSGAVSTEQAWVGAQSLKVTFSGSSGANGAGADAPISVTSGLPYTFSRWVYVPTGQTPVRLQIQRAGMTTLSSPESSVFDQWERLSITFTPTTTAAHDFFVLNSVTTAAGKYFYTDGFLLEQTATLKDYFDGSTVKAGLTYAWTGTAHASTSTETGPVSLYPTLSGSGTLTTRGMPRANLLTNPSSETNTTSWAGVNGSSFVSSADQAWTGTKSLKVTTTAGQGADQTGASISNFPFSSGVTYTFSAYVYVPTGMPAVRIKFGGASANVSGTTSTLKDQWERLSVTWTATGNVGVWLYILNQATSVAGTAFYVDGAMLETSPSLNAYFDGDSSNAGSNYTWTGTPHASTSREHSVPTGVPYIKARYATTNVVTANPTVAVTNYVDAGDVLLLLTYAGSGNIYPTAVSGCGATWSKVANTKNTVQEAWIGVGATASGTVTATATNDTNGRTLNLYHISGTSSAVVGDTTSPLGSGSSPVLSAGAGQVVVGTTYTRSTDGGISALLPAAGWTTEPVQTPTSGRYIGRVSRIPSTTDNHSYTGTTAAGYNVLMQEVVVGTVVAVGVTINSAFTGAGVLSTGLVYPKRISSAFTGGGVLGTQWSNFVNISSSLTGSGTLATVLTGYQRISSGFSGAGSLSTVWSGYRNYRSDFTGSGTLSTHLGQAIRSDFTGSGTLAVDLLNKISSSFTGSGSLSTYVLKTIRSGFSGEGTLTTAVVFPSHIMSAFAGSGSLSAALSFSRRFDTAYGSEGVLQTELGFVIPVPELGTAPLGKLVAFNVGSSAVPLNPAEGSGATPTVSATYLAGLDVEFALGENNVLSNDSVGTYAGEIVSLDTEKGSDNAVISTTTPLSLLNLDMVLFPFIDASSNTWTAARAIDYWTQQTGLFYDDVPGTCVSYASAFGHAASYAAGTTKHFYEKSAGSTVVLNNRSVKTFSGLTAFHEDAKASVPVSLSKNELLVFSIGLGIRGTGRTASVTWNFLDSAEVKHTLRITGTSAGLITAEADDVLIDSTTVAGTANYRVTAALERLSGTALSGRLTVHTDDLNGALTSAYSGAAQAIVLDLPGTMRLKSVNHVSVGGSSTQMLRWGTYLTIATAHPRALPVLKDLSQTETAREFVSGFEGNVWGMLNEFCSIARLDIQYLDNKLTTSQRIDTLTAPGGNFSEFQRSASRRDKFKQVAVVNRQSKASTTDDAIFWRADSVFQIAAREVFETTVQTEHSILSLVQPTAVLGIEPFPYKKGSGQYVVTGADGYIVSPAWWAEHGGKVEVSLTEKSGEIAIKITAPTLDTVRAPYRISEGAGDRPALYIAGSGILNDPIEVHVGTGALNAKEGFDSVYESPFISTVSETYDAAIEMAAEYSADVAEISFAIPNSFGETSRFGKFPSGALFTDNIRNYRIVGVNQTHSKVSGTAVPYTTVGAYVDSFPTDATIEDEMVRHAGRTLKQVVIKPLRGTIETA